MDTQIAELCTQLAQLSSEIVCAKASPSLVDIIISHAEAVSIGLTFGLIGTIMFLVILFKVPAVQEWTFSHADTLNRIVSKYDKSNNTNGTINDTDLSIARTIAIGGIRKSIIAAAVLVFFGLISM